ncbi:MAG: methyltransferase [Pseudomonadota bacterium]
MAQKGRFGRGPRAWMLRLAASARFQSFAARTPLLAQKARREGEEMFDLIAGFAKSQTLFALVDLGVLERLSHGPADAGDAAPELTERAAALVLDAGCAIGILGRSKGRYSLTARGAALMGVPGVIPMIRHHAVMYRDMADPVALLRRETDPELAKFWPYVFGAAAAQDPDTTRAYSELMADSQRLVAADTLRTVDLSNGREVLDIGGGTGAFLTAVGAACKHPRLHLFDLPAVVPGAESRFRDACLANRTQITSGSFRDDDLPQGADVITLIRVLYDHADDTVRRLLAKVYDALPPGGRIVVSEPMTGGQTPTVAGDIYFAFYTYCMETGRARSQAEIADLLSEAGFVDLKMPKPRRAFVTSIVTARKQS